MAERSKQRGSQTGDHTQHARQEPPQHVPIERQKTAKGARKAKKPGRK